MNDHSDSAVFRILDANLNRLREALRLVEEYFRFARTDAAIAGELKLLRHSLQSFESGLDKTLLLQYRDTIGDPFADVNRPEEKERSGVEAVAWAGLKRGQEAARVLEEYVKVIDKQDLSDTAKQIRFKLYALEKRLMEIVAHG